MERGRLSAGSSALTKHFSSGHGQDLPAGIFADLLAAQLLLHKLLVQLVVAVHCKKGAGHVDEKPERKATCGGVELLGWRWPLWPSPLW